MVGRVSTYAIHNQSVGDFSRLQAELAKLQQQISSGRKASTFAELGTSLTTVVNLEASITSANKFVDSNNRIISRLGLMESSVTQLQDMAADLMSKMPLELGSSGEDFNITEFSQNALEQVRDLLNTKEAGRSLFAGGKTNINPVGDLRYVTNVLDGNATANYYQGDDQVFSTNASENLSVEYGIKANDQAFQDLIAAYHKIMDYEASGTDADYEEAYGFVQSAVAGLNAMRSSIGLDMGALEDSNAQHEATSALLTDSLNDEIGVDLVEATIKSSLTEATLTATLQTFSRISQLTLSDFIR